MKKTLAFAALSLVAASFLRTISLHPTRKESA